MALPSAMGTVMNEQALPGEQRPPIQNAPHYTEETMHVGYAVACQNPDNRLSDAEIYRNELRLAEMAEPLGFDSVWSVEHHFDDYTMVPDVLQFLSFMAG